MGCNYWVDPIKIPADSIKKVEKLLEKHSLEDGWPFIIDGQRENYVPSEGYATLRMEDSNMGHSTAEAVDSFLTDLAEILAGTSYDGQRIQYDYELGEAIGHHIFINGERIEVPLELITVPSESVKVGERYRATVEVEVLGLSDNKVAVVGS